MRMQPGRTVKTGYAPSQETLRRLELSRQKAGGVKTREMHCPICGFLVQIIPVTQTLSLPSAINASSQGRWIRLTSAG